jgi:hypothetical protein
MTKICPNCHEIKQITTKCTKWPINAPTFSIQKHTKIYGFGMKIYHLATPIQPTYEKIFQSSNTNVR